MRPPLACLLAVLLLAGCSAGRAPEPGTPARDEPIAGVVLTPGIEPSHRDGPVRYDRVPPVGGPHNPVWVRCEVYDSAVPPELAVHALEHGAVWLTYGPDLPDEGVQQLAALHGLDATTREYVLVSPYDDLLSPVSPWPGARRCRCRRPPTRD